MWSMEARAVTRAGAEAVWRRWSEVGTWSEWDPEVEWAQLEGDVRLSFLFARVIGRNIACGLPGGRSRPRACWYAPGTRQTHGRLRSR
jgi:hypothetical protein